MWSIINANDKPVMDNNATTGDIIFQLELNCNVDAISKVAHFV